MRRHGIFRASVAILLLGGCAHLPVGRLDGPTPPPPHVYLLRGLQDWYSAGIDTLGRELAQHGIGARVFRESQWRDLRAALLQRRLPADELVLVGFSYGADDAIRVARAMDAAQQPVDLLITIDPVTPPPVPANVRLCVNFYQSNGVWDALPFLRGVPLRRGGGDRQPLRNINLRTRPDLLEPHTSHASIAGNERVHAAIIDLVLNLFRRSSLRMTAPPPGG